MDQLLLSVVFGLANGLSPGPTLTMVVTQTLQNNLKSGIQIALAPIIFGLVIIPISLLTLSTLGQIKLFIGIISVVGAAYVAYLGIKLIKQPIPLPAKRYSSCYKTGIFINFASPFAYIFWFTVGGPLLGSAFHKSILYGTLVIFFYYLFLIGSKVMVAILVSKSKNYLAKRTYVCIIRFLGKYYCLFIQ